MTKVLFVCTANQNRSVMAEFVMRSKLTEMRILDVEAGSAGIRAKNGIAPLPHTTEICKQSGINPSSHRSRLITKKIIEGSDIILVMENRQIKDILKKHPEAKDKLKLLSYYYKEFKNQDIKDPVGGSIFDFRLTFTIITGCITTLIKEISKVKEPETQKNIKVLIADDDPSMRKLLKHSLLKWNYEVVECADGLKAWEVIRSKDSPSILILDWIMPGMDGIELCHKIRKLNREPYPYILLFTSKSEVKDMVMGIEAGADDFIIKTCVKIELRVRLKAGRRIIEMSQKLLDSRNELARIYDEKPDINR